MHLIVLLFASWNCGDNIFMFGNVYIYSNVYHPGCMFSTLFQTRNMFHRGNIYEGLDAARIARILSL